MDNFVVGVVTSKNLEKRYRTCMDTWAKDFDFIHFFGGELEDESLIKVPGAGDDYYSHFPKQQYGLKYLFEVYPDMDWYNMASCDNVLYKSTVVGELSKYDSDQPLFITEPCGTWVDLPFIRCVNGDEKTTGTKFTASAGGASFWISNSLMKLIYPYFDEFNKYWIEKAGTNLPYSDVAISYMIKKYTNIDLTYNNTMFSQNLSFYENLINNPSDPNRIWYDDVRLDSIIQGLKNPMSFHYVLPDEMDQLYKKFK
jgi:hypothetical protein